MATSMMSLGVLVNLVHFPSRCFDLFFDKNKFFVNNLNLLRYMVGY